MLGYRHDAPLAAQFVPEPGAPTSWHGAALIDYHPLHTARCFATGFIIFVIHWYIYVRFIHQVCSWSLRVALSAAAVGTYLLAVLHLHPWQPYWIRELSVMLAQLFAWKVADLTLLRHGEQLRRFWPFILFDVLALRPNTLVLPHRYDDEGAPAAAAAPAAAGALQGSTAAAAGTVGRGGAAVARGQADAAALDAAAGKAAPGPSKGRQRDGVFISASAGTAAVTAASAAAAALSDGSRRTAKDARATARGGVAAGGRQGGSSSSSRATPAPAAPAPSPAAPAPAASTASSVLCSRLWLAVSVVRGPLLDFLWTYNACEAANAFLMHRRAEEVLSAPLLTQAGLSFCFATALYFHLRYFFYSMEMLWMLGFALAVGERLPRWAPLFDSPERSTSPMDFWNNRWHQAFRWWWTRLVFTPVRRLLKSALQQPLLFSDHSSVDGGSSGVVQRSGGCVRGCDGNCGGNCGGTACGEQQATVAAAASSQPSVKGRQQRQRPGQPPPRTPDDVGKHPDNRLMNLVSRSGEGSGNARARAPGPRSGSSSSNGRLTELLCGRVGRWLARNRGAVLTAVPTVAVFAFSAAFHESLLLINFGRATGEQTAFFMLHAALLLAQRAAQTAAPQLCRRLATALPAPLRAAAFVCLGALTSVLFFRPWFRNSYHRELRVLMYGPTGWAVRVWVVGLPREGVRLLW